MSSTSPKALLATASIAVALAAADTYVVVLALTDMMRGVGIGIDSLQKATPIISGFLLGYIAVLPLIGRIADLVPRGRVLLACLALFVVGSAVTALAVDLPVLVGGRVIQGVGGGGLVPATLALVADLWPADRRGMPLGVVGAVQELGSVLGPLLGALILAIADWRWIFWVNAVLGIVLALVLRRLAPSRGQNTSPEPVPSRRGVALRWRVVLAALAAVVLGLALAAPERLVADVTLGLPFVPFSGHGARLLTPIGVAGLVLGLLSIAVELRAAWPTLRRADLVGAGLLGATLGLVVLTFASANPEREVVGPIGFTLLPIAVVTAGLYLWHHRHAAQPLVARGVVVGRARIALLVSLAVGIALVAVVVDVPLYARLAYTESETVAAFVLLRFLLAVPVGALLGGWLLRRFGDGAVAGVGLALAALGLEVMARWDADALNHASATVALAVVGLGIGLALAPVNNAALADAPHDAHGTASALVVVARMVGMVVGLAVLTAVGLHQYYLAVAALPDQTDGKALLGAALVQVHWVFRGAALAALLGAVASATGLGIRRLSAPTTTPSFGL